MQKGCNACEVMVGIVQNKYPQSTPGFKDMVNLRIIRELNAIGDLAGCGKNFICLPILRLKDASGQGIQKKP